MRLSPLGFLIVFVAIPAGCSTARAEDPPAPGSCLRYTKPADINSYRLHAMPLGNGRVGAMVAGDQESDVVLLNDHRLRNGALSRDAGIGRSRVVAEAPPPLPDRKA